MYTGSKIRVRRIAYGWWTVEIPGRTSPDYHIGGKGAVLRAALLATAAERRQRGYKH